MNEFPDSSEVPNIPISAVSLHALGVLSGILFSIFTMHQLVLLGEGRNPNVDAVVIQDWVETKRSIAQEKESPKLILAGGSNVFFGLHAETLSESLGSPVVNLGTHGALPSTFHFYELDKVLNEGDVVLYLPEYEKYRENGYQANTGSVSYLISNAHDYLEKIPRRHYLAILFSLRGTDYFGHFFIDDKKFNKRIQRFRRQMGTVMSSYGDVLNNRESDQTTAMKANRVNILPVSLDQLQLLDFRSLETTGNFARMIVSEHGRLNAKGVTLFFSWPNTIDAPEHHTDSTRRKFEELGKLLRSHGVRVVGDPYSAMLPKSDFFDSNYHLLKEPSRKRSERLLPELRRALADVGFPMTEDSSGR